MMRDRRKRRFVVVAAVVAVVAALASATPSTASGPTVTIKGSLTYHFQPKTVRISKGGTVHWSWNSNAPHNVTFRKLGKHSKTKSKGSYQLTFKRKGTFKYLCTIHGFTGKVVVG